MAFRDDVAAPEARFVEAFGRGDAKACAAVYTEDAVYLVPGQKPVRSRAAIDAATVRELASGLKIARLTAFHTESSGDLGYALETFSSSAGDGIAMLTCRRDASGAWRICAEAFLAIWRYSGSVTPRWRQAAISVLLSSSAMVIGPTPPGTGVIAPALG